MNSIARLSLALTVVGLGSLASADPAYYTNVADFLADPRAGSLATETFDGFAVGTNLTGANLGGASLSAPGASPLSVLDGATGVRHPMSPSSGANILSPGGSDPNAENDDLRIDFATPVSAFGLDIVFDEPDGASYTSVTFLDAAGATIFTDGFVPAPGGAPGDQFVGLVADTPSIASVVFDEYDDSASDDNVAYDTMRYTSSVPEPATLAILGAGAVGLLRRRRTR